MFSPRLLAVFALLLATVAALPATDKPAIPKPVTTITEDDLDDSPWFSFPLFGNLFAPLWKLLPSFGEIGPRIVADNNQFKVIVNVKDYKKEDLKVKVKGDFIFVQGSHEAKQTDRDVFASQFFHTYTLPQNSSGSDVTAEITNDGYLIVNAPLSDVVTRAKDVEREVPITETNAPLPKEETTSKSETTTTTVPPTSVAALADNDDDRKEPTTQATEEKLKENSIPYGNPNANEIP